MTRFPWLAALVVATLLARLSPTEGPGPAAPVQVSDSVPAPGLLRLITEPQAGMAPIYHLLASPRTSLDLTMYELDDPEVVAVLAADAARGVDVRVLLDSSGELRVRAENRAAYDELAARGAHVRWASRAYPYTHEKAFVVDRRQVVIMTLNFTPRYYATSRDFAVVDADPADVAAVTTVFDADFALPAAPDRLDPAGTDLTWSPAAGPADGTPPYPKATRPAGPRLHTGQAALDVVRLIDAAASNLWVENEELSDRAVLDALTRAAGRGVRVRLITTDPGDGQAWAELRSSGVQVAGYGPGAAIYIHAKAVVADRGLPDQRAFVGSENFSATSLYDNRELGIITGDRRLVGALGDQLADDFAQRGAAGRGRPGTTPSTAPATRHLPTARLTIPPENPENPKTPDERGPVP